MVSPTYPCTHTSLDVSLIRCLLASIDKIPAGAIHGCDSGPVQVGLSFAPNASKGIGQQLCCTWRYETNSDINGKWLFFLKKKELD